MQHLSNDFLNSAIFQIALIKVVEFFCYDIFIYMYMFSYYKTYTDLRFLTLHSSNEFKT